MHFTQKVRPTIWVGQNYGWDKIMVVGTKSWGGQNHGGGDKIMGGTKSWGGQNHGVRNSKRTSLMSRLIQAIPLKRV